MTMLRATRFSQRLLNAAIGHLRAVDKGYFRSLQSGKIDPEADAKGFSVVWKS
ncbi:hypothetical protein [Pseudomonas sp. BE134]|uniref:hypothetical protein n=1 Tax=Pseudomonas sp. BE134 TaxID=2817843 RepID=UPI00285642CA|nr:hypothetical protein [Pseudomonas sp. BE134]MDR6924380.1 hypothetical protein [Pseudomonas sp. BE134]